MEYSMEDYEQEQRDTDARTALMNLKLELAIRQDNEHVGSGLGGSPTEFWWLLNNPVRAIGVVQGVGPSFKKSSDGKEILFYSPKKPSMKDVRNALTQFLDSNYANRQSVTQEQLTNLSFVKDWAYDKLEVNLFIQALEHTAELSRWLDVKKDMQNKLHELSSKECDDLAVRFLRERGLSDTYFEEHKDEKNNPVKRMMNRHPVWGTRIKAVHARYGEMVGKLLSPEDKEKLEMVGAFPAHIALFVFRTQVGIETIVHLNLDELPACNFLVEINKEFSDKKEDDDTSIEDED